MTFAFGRLADYFRAVAALDAAGDPEKQRAIAAVLGLMDRDAKSTPVPSTIEPMPMRTVIPPTSRQRESSPSTTRISAPPAAAVRHVRGQPGPSIEYTVTPRPTRAERPGWLDHVKALPPPRTEVRTPPAPASLLAPRWSRAILSTALARETLTNQVDLEAIVYAASRGLPLRRVPFRILPTLSRGVQLLVDRGPASAPFLRDQDLLVHQIQVVVGNDRLQVLRFDPSREFIAGKGPRTRWRNYFIQMPPPPGVTVVLISDLGITHVPHESSARPHEWCEFLARLRARGHRVITFVPFAPSRWPRLSLGLVHLLPWDRRTSVQIVRRMAGHRRVRRAMP